MSRPPRIPDSGDDVGPVITEIGFAPLLKSLRSIDDGSPAEAGERASATGQISSDSRPKLSGLTEAASKIGIHLDGAALDTATANASGFWQHTATHNTHTGAPYGA